MFRCTKCGAENPLGSVFCRQCGAKMDLRGLTSETVVQAQRPSLFARVAPMLVVVPLVLLLAAAGLALWPTMKPLGEAGTLVGARRVESRLRSFRVARPGMTVGADPAFVEKDINGYFQYIKAEPLRLNRASVDVMPGAIRFRIVRPLLSADVGPDRKSVV